MGGCEDEANRGCYGEQADEWCGYTSKATPHKFPIGAPAPVLNLSPGIRTSRSLRKDSLQHERVRGRLRDPPVAPARLPCVPRAAVVVEHDVALFRALGQLAHCKQKLTQLIVRVQVVEPLRGAATADIPGPGVPSVHPHVDHRARLREDGGDKVLRLRLRRVDDDGGCAELLEKREDLRSVLVLEPAAVAELDERVVAPKLLLRPFQVLEGQGLAHDVGGKLQQDPAELSGRAQWLERLVEAREDL